MPYLSVDVLAAKGPASTANYNIHIILANHGKYNVSGWYHKFNYTMYLWYWPTMIISVIGLYYKCDYLYYVDMVLANCDEQYDWLVP